VTTVHELQRVAVAVGVLVIGIFGLQAAAGAAGGYPPPTTVGTTCSVSASISVGRSTTIDPSCRFAPGSSITVTLNGAAYATVTAPTTGVFAERFAATDPHLALNGGAVRPTQFGATNIFVASGTNPAGAPNVATTLVTIPAAGSTALADSGVALRDSYVMARVMGGLALLALAFLILTFARRRIPTASAR
jgi:hypothetical protein